MIVLDTHAWFWWLAEPKRLSRKAQRVIESASEIGICSMSVLELTGLVERGRITLDAPLRTWVRAGLAQPRVSERPLTAEIALDAGQLRGVRDPADRVIYATVRAEDALLVTRDADLLEFDPARTVW